MFDKLNLQQLRGDWDKLANINKSGGDEDGRVHGGPGGQGGLSSEKMVRQYFAQISKENITRLFQKYQVDFEMFGYENQVQKFIDMGF